MQVLRLDFTVLLKVLLFCSRLHSGRAYPAAKRRLLRRLIYMKGVVTIGRSGLDKLAHEYGITLNNNSARRNQVIRLKIGQAWLANGKVRPIPKQRTAEPRRAKLRIDIELPRWRKSSTDLNKATSNSTIGIAIRYRCKKSNIWKIAKLNFNFWLQICFDE